MTTPFDEIPPRDSWIRLKPGATMIVTDNRLAAERVRLSRWSREIRGDVLATCFEIEFQLDCVIGQILFPEPSSAENQKSFQELFLKGTTSRFSSKIDWLKKLRMRSQALEAIIPEGLSKNLNDIRDIRNDFAHYPVTLDLAGDPPNQTLVASLISKRGEFLLNDVLLQQWQALFSDAMRALEEITRALPK